jgi:hypothetical protein
MELETAARRVGEAGSDLAEAATRLSTLPSAASMFGADGSGALGELGRALARQADAAIAARATEARALSESATGLAAKVGSATASLRDLDGSTRRGGA